MGLVHLDVRFEGRLPAETLGASREVAGVGENATVDAGMCFEIGTFAEDLAAGGMGTATGLERLALWALRFG